MANNEQKIWQYFEKKGFSKCGIAGLMGNLYAESGLYPQNLQNTYNSLLGMTDAEYTTAVDKGTYTNFVNDAAGYGLAQWTYYSRKENLLKFAKEKNKSIGDLTLQLDFLYKELKENFNSVYKTLCSATTVLEASNAILFKFENPAVQNTSVQNQRASYGQKYYDQFVTGSTTTKEETITVSKTIKTGFLTAIINGIKIDSSKPCNSDNYNSYDSRKVEYIVMHYTGNSKDTAWANANYFQSPNRGASAHFFVDNDSIYQSIKLKDMAWHCGTDGAYYHNYCRNTNSFGIEMCCTAGNYKISSTTIKNAAYLCAHLCKLLGITANKVDQYVLRHYDVTHKECPAQMVDSSPTEDKDWTAFKKQVKKILGSTTTTSSNNKTTTTTTTELYRVRKTWDDAESQLGAFTNLEGAKKICRTGYKVFNSKGKVVYNPNKTTSAKAETKNDNSKLTLKEVSLYSSSDAKTAKKKISGTYYIYSNEVINNKIRITNSKANIGKSGQVTGWIKVSDAKITNSASALKEYSATVTADLLNVRVGAGMSYIVTSQLKKGTKVKVSKESNNWGYISGKGWICLDYVKKV